MCKQIVPSFLGSTLVDIFIIENSILLNLTKYITFWKLCVDDMISFLKICYIAFIISVLNSFDKNIHFKFEKKSMKQYHSWIF